MLTASLAATALLGLAPLSLEEEEPPEVKAELLSRTESVIPGGRFSVGLRLRIEEEHWHVYWRNPGQSGMATELSIEAPEGFEVEDVLFPVPQRFETGDLVSYGYEGEVLLIAYLRAPRDLAVPGTVTLEASARWLVCKELCFLGEADLTLDLPTARETRPNADNAELFERWLPLLPRPWSELEGVDARWKDDGVMELGIRGARSLEFFPDYHEIIEPRSQRALPVEGGAGLRLGFDTSGPADSDDLRLRGVLRVERADGVRAYELDLPFGSTEEGPPHPDRKLEIPR